MPSEDAEYIAEKISEEVKEGFLILSRRFGGTFDSPVSRSLEEVARELAEISRTLNRIKRNL